MSIKEWEYLEHHQSFMRILSIKNWNLRSGGNSMHRENIYEELIADKISEEQILEILCDHKIVFVQFIGQYECLEAFENSK